MPRGARWLGGGDDPAYVDGIARVLRTRRVAYQAYFYAHDTAGQLRRSPRSRRRLRALYRLCAPVTAARTTGPRRVSARRPA
jgi:hypothetical protein